MTQVFGKIRLWVDDGVRGGPENMAVDEWLLESCRDMPVLRVYRWTERWGSLGYFGGIDAARAAFPGLEWVRRWTGGGLVDHRDDWTYTLVVPVTEPMARWKGAESYREVHEALARVLATEGSPAMLSTGDEGTGAAACFANPVEHDVTDGSGEKLAGAGQRRTRHGLLHQGSVAGALQATASRTRALALAVELAGEVEEVHLSPDAVDLAKRVEARYAAWTDRR